MDKSAHLTERTSKRPTIALFTRANLERAFVTLLPKFVGCSFVSCNNCFWLNVLGKIFYKLAICLVAIVRPNLGHGLLCILLENFFSAAVTRASWSIPSSILESRI